LAGGVSCYPTPENIEVATPWRIRTDARLDAYCWKIARELVTQFGISESEAVGRINRDWRFDGIDSRFCIEYGPEFHLAYHELPEYWAQEIYYGRDSHWWMAPEERQRLGLGPLESLPYP
jgi:hypothetical protein